jgi:hypothetical protein
MTIHFEELWEKCENFHKESNNNESITSIIDELMMKLNLYKAIAAKSEVQMEDRQKVKYRALGEILLTITNLSLKDNVNVFEALNIAQQYRSVELKKF